MPYIIAFCSPNNLEEFNPYPVRADNVVNALAEIKSAAEKMHIPKAGNVTRIDVYAVDADGERQYHGELEGSSRYWNFDF